jgi:predicted ester cyclase
MSDTVNARLGRRFDAAELRAIKRLWVRHSIAEERHDIDGLVNTIAEQGEYEMVPTGQHWYGHSGVRAFYTELFGAFPDNRFDMTEIVVGPQGVFEAARLTATNVGPWAGIPASGLPVDLEVLILFTWDPRTRLFLGEKIWFDASVLGPALGRSARETRDQG